MASTLTCFVIFHEKHPFQNVQNLKVTTTHFDSPCSCWIMTGLSKQCIKVAKVCSLPGSIVSWIHHREFVLPPSAPGIVGGRTLSSLPHRRLPQTRSGGGRAGTSLCDAAWPAGKSRWGAAPTWLPIPQTNPRPAGTGWRLRSLCPHSWWVTCRRTGCRNEKLREKRPAPNGGEVGERPSPSHRRQLS